VLVFTSNWSSTAWATCALKKLWVNPVSIGAVNSLSPTCTRICIVSSVRTPAMACREINGSLWQPA
jgi:hypothetical protein